MWDPHVKGWWMWRLEVGGGGTFGSQPTEPKADDGVAPTLLISIAAAGIYRRGEGKDQEGRTEIVG
jgi:hypothetical protein